MTPTQTPPRLEKLSPPAPTGGSGAVAAFTPDAAKPSARDAVYGTVSIGWALHSRAVANDRFGVARLVTHESDAVATEGLVVVGDAQGPLQRGRGFLRRRASDVHLELGGRRFTLHHTSNWRAQLLRDGQAIGWLRRRRSGKFFWDGFRAGGWQRTYEVTRWTDPADPTAAAVAHLLAAQYEVGATGAVINTFAVLSLPFRLLGG
jgi:hypothetical protein